MSMGGDQDYEVTEVDDGYEVVWDTDEPDAVVDWLDDNDFVIEDETGTTYRAREDRDAEAWVDDDGEVRVRVYPEEDREPEEAEQIAQDIVDLRQYNGLDPFLTEDDPIEEVDLDYDQIRDEYSLGIEDNSHL